MEILGPDGHMGGAEPAALALGYFDGVHIGHTAVIRAALAAPGPTVVVTFRAAAVTALKGNGARALMSDSLREQVLESMGVDAVAYLDFGAVRNLTPGDFVQDILVGRLHAGFVSCGFNYSFGRGGSGGPADMAGLCARHGVRTATIAPVCLEGETVSSTRIRSLVERGEMEHAAAMLGRPFALRLPVAHGRKLGRELGMPTINQPLPDCAVVPRFGVYAAAVRLDGREYLAVADVGCKPTVGSDYILAETYILDYEGDLYGREVTVELLHFMRPEEKYDDLETLRRQMQADAEAAARYGRENRAELISPAESVESAGREDGSSRPTP